MAQQLIDTTTPQPGGKFGEPIPTSFEKANANFTELYSKIVEEQALATDYYGAAEPDPTWAGMVWADSANAVRKIRNAANDAWITLGPLFTPFGSAAFLNSIEPDDVLYGRRSVVGTVAHDGNGLPTGALVQYGSNANGEYFRFVGGWQVCVRRSSGTLGIGNALYGGFSTDPITWTFPAAFTASPATSGSPVPGHAFGLSIYASGVASAEFRLTSVSSQGAAPRAFCLIAMGYRL